MSELNSMEQEGRRNGHAFRVINGHKVICQTTNRTTRARSLVWYVDGKTTARANLPAALAS
jgi:hypothetical protein